MFLSMGAVFGVFAAFYYWSSLIFGKAYMSVNKDFLAVSDANESYISDARSLQNINEDLKLEVYKEGRNEFSSYVPLVQEYSLGHFFTTFIGVNLLFFLCIF